jgi:ribonuclease HII
MPDYALEAALGGMVCGIDEAGRGPWAGPVVAAACVIDITQLPTFLRTSLDDSKKLSAKKREVIFAALEEEAGLGSLHFAAGEASVEEIDTINILRATMAAMTRAVGGLSVRPDHALVDGTTLPDLPCPGQAVSKGDGLSLSIAAASIVAKVTRDRLMAALDKDYQGYGFAHNAGYGTAEHQAALARLGVTPHHRKSFAPIHKILCGS